MVLVSLSERIAADLEAAVKTRQEPDRTVLRSLTAAIKNEAIAAKGELDEAAITNVVSKQVKQRAESVEAYATRPELAAKEEAEAEVLKRYLPAQLDPDELTKLVDEAVSQSGASTMADMGKVMGILKPKLAGRADSGAVAAMVKDRLG